MTSLLVTILSVLEYLQLKKSKDETGRLTNLDLHYTHMGNILDWEISNSDSYSSVSTLLRFNSIVCIINDYG